MDTHGPMKSRSGACWTELRCQCTQFDNLTGSIEKSADFGGDIRKWRAPTRFERVTFAFGG
jgi:hypothetical protein